MVEITDHRTNTTGENTINMSDPFYVHHSDNLAMILVPAVFDGVGYRSWRSLLAKNKLRFINGECKRPALNSPQYYQWERCDNMVTSWILNSLGKEITDSVEYLSNALELWKELEDHYDETNGAKLY